MIGASMASRVKAAAGVRMIWLSGILLMASAGRATAGVDAFPRQELNVNLFRSPSMGMEYARAGISVHFGFFPSVLSRGAKGEEGTIRFLKIGTTLFFLPLERSGGKTPSSFYVSMAYLHGVDDDWRHAFSAEGGFRWFVWEGLNLRLGGGAIVGQGHRTQLIFTEGVGWSFPL